MNQGVALRIGWRRWLDLTGLVGGYRFNRCLQLIDRQPLISCFFFLSKDCSLADRIAINGSGEVDIFVRLGGPWLLGIRQALPGIGWSVILLSWVAFQADCWPCSPISFHRFALGEMRH